MMPRRVMLEYHLQYNHYPPPPNVSALADICKGVIAMVEDGADWYDEFELPEGVTLANGNTSFPVGEFIAAWHLENLIERDDE